MRTSAATLACFPLLCAAVAAQTPVKKTAAVTTVTTLTPLAPAGAPVTGLTVSGTPMVATLRWTADPNAVSYQVFRIDGPNAFPALQSPSPIPPKAAAGGFSNTVPQPNVTYQYLVVATYNGGATGEARIAFVSPPPTNPTTVTARDLGNGSFALSWPAVAGAVGYRVDGPALPSTGQTVSTTSATISNVPAGPQTWGVTAMFPGNYADYATATKVNVVNRLLPSHGPFLVKSAGPGSAAMATTARDRSTVNDHVGVPTPCTPGAAQCSLGAIINAWGIGMGSAGVAADIMTPDIYYTNTTELGTPRRTKCMESEAPQAPAAILCYTESPGGFTLIVQSNLGTRFAVFENNGRSGMYYDNIENVLTKTFDSEGPKFAPHACMACHGGTYDPKTGLVQGATLLPIDPGLVDLGGNRAANEEGIRKLNAMIYKPPVGAGAPSPAVAQYINEMYGGVGPTGGAVLVPGARAAANHVPAGWVSDQGFYQNIVKPNCAMCHLATNPALNINFLSTGNFLKNKDVIFNVVCKLKTMPHAELPFRRFWTSGSGPVYLPGVFAARLGYPSCS